MDMWTKQQINDHTKAAEILVKIVNEAFGVLREGISEYQVMQFILKQFKEEGLKTDRKFVIVAFNSSAASPHYYPKKKSQRLKRNSLVLIDIWARLDKKKAPFADITWMGWYGDKTPKKIKKLFDLIIEGRNNGVKLIEKKLKNKVMPTGSEIDLEVYRLIPKTYKRHILHRTGHSLGTTSPHGIHGRVRYSNKKALHTNRGYTIEPGLYFKGKYGFRTEIDFYITPEYKLVVTGEAQREMVLSGKKPLSYFYGVLSKKSAAEREKNMKIFRRSFNKRCLKRISDA